MLARCSYGRLCRPSQSVEHRRVEVGAIQLWYGKIVSVCHVSSQCRRSSPYPRFGHTVLMAQVMQLLPVVRSALGHARSAGVQLLPRLHLDRQLASEAVSAAHATASGRAEAYQCHQGHRPERAAFFLPAGRAESDASRAHPCPRANRARRLRARAAPGRY